MYDDYWEYEKPQSLSDECGGAALGLGISAIFMSATAALTLFMRFDIVSSLLFAGLGWGLTYLKGMDVKTMCIVVIASFVISMYLQHKWVICRIIFGLFACAAIATLATIIIGYESQTRMYTILGVGFLISAVWGIFSWLIYIKN